MKLKDYNSIKSMLKKSENHILISDIGISISGSKLDLMCLFSKLAHTVIDKGQFTKEELIKIIETSVMSIDELFKELNDITNSTMSKLEESIKTESKKESKKEYK